MTPRAFSFNSPHGACPECQGLGAMYDFDPARLVPDESLSLLDGAIAPWASGRQAAGARGARRRSAGNFGIDLAAPFGEAAEEGARPAAQRPGSPVTRATGTAAATRRGARGPLRRDFEGLIPNLRRRFEHGTWAEQEELERYRSLRPCPACDGERLKPQSRSVRVKGRTITEYVDLPLERRAAARSSRWRSRTASS